MAVITVTGTNTQPDDEAWTLRHLSTVAWCVLLLILPALLNRAPFLYFDSGAYLSQAGKAVQLLEGRLGLVIAGEADDASAGASALVMPQAPDDRIVAGRSIYYGLLAWGGAQALGVGTIVVVQALVLAILIVMTLQTVWPEAPPASRATAAVTLAGGLALLTSAGFFVSLVMPDIWAGMMILAFALLVAGGSGLGTGAHLTLGAIMALAALFHASHLALLAALIGLLVPATLQARPRRGLPPRRLAVPALALACGLAGHVAFSVSVRWATGEPPLSMPRVTAHLVDMGPGTRLARETCPESGFAICPYADRLPTGWIDFLFSRDPRTGVFGTVPPSVQRALSEEQTRYALSTLAAEPLATTGGLLRDAVAQLWHLSVDDVPLTAANEGFLAASFTQEVAATARASAIWNRPWVAPALSRLIQAGTALAAVGLLALALAGRLPRRGPLATLILLCLTGLVLNALICGAFASPYGRFQARVAWLLPFLLVLTALATRLRAPRETRASGRR